MTLEGNDQIPMCVFDYYCELVVTGDVGPSWKCWCISMCIVCGLRIGFSFATKAEADSVIRSKFLDVCDPQTHEFLDDVLVPLGAPEACQALSVHSIFEICRVPLLFLGDPVMQQSRRCNVIQGRVVFLLVYYL